MIDFVERGEEAVSMPLAGRLVNDESLDTLWIKTQHAADIFTIFEELQGRHGPDPELTC